MFGATIITILVLFILSIYVLVVHKRIGSFLAMVSLFAVGAINLLFISLEISFNLSYNRLFYGENLILLLLLIPISLWLFWRSNGKKRIIVFLLSVSLFQNFLINLMYGLADRGEEFREAMDFLHFIVIPIVFIMTFIWGLVFDFVSNKSKKRHNAKEEII